MSGSTKRLWRAVPCAFALLLVVAASPAQGRRRQLPEDKTRNHESVRDAFGSSLEDVAKSAVQVVSGTDVLALGTVVADGGYVVTKASEIGNARSLQCKLADGSTVPARVIGRDRDCDLALLQVEAKGLRPVRWVTAPPAVARIVATVALEATPLSFGVVSLPVYTPTARRGQASRRPGRLGVLYRAGDGEATLATVRRGSAAAQAGLAVGDVVLEMDGVLVSSSSAMVEVLQGHFGGDTVRVVVRRGEDEKSFDVTLDAAPERRRNVNSQQRLWGDLSEVRSGFPRILQHDTVLQPDQCGGPVATLDGEVAGINIARVGRVETWALPADLVQETVAKILAEAEATAGGR